MPRPSVRRPPLLVDDRKGSADLFDELKQIGCPVKLTRLKYPCYPKSGPDFEFDGNGPSGIVKVGIERKKVSELLTDITNTRFTAQQLPALLKTYPAFPLLIVEGVYKPGRHGELQTYGREGYTRGYHSYAMFEHFLMTLQFKAGLPIVNTSGHRETCFYLHALYSWCQKRWSAHKSAYHIYERTPDAAIMGDQTSPEYRVRKFAAQLPDVYWERSKPCAETWSNVRDMVNASQAEWKELDGFGPTRARKIWRWLRGMTV